jgi:hypothetical protein
MLAGMKVNTEVVGLAIVVGVCYAILHGLGVL